MGREMRGWFKMEGTYVYLWLIHAKVRHAAAAAKSPQSCPTLRDPIDGSPPGSAISGILQARTLECVAISFSNVRHKPAQFCKAIILQSNNKYIKIFLNDWE